MHNINSTSKIKDYLLNRNLDNHIISEFELGYSEDSYSQVLKFLQKENFFLLG